MKYVSLGQTGMRVSRICFGCMSYGSKSWMPWVIEAEEARAHYARAIEAGINFFDTSNNYSLGESERLTGRYLDEMGRRDEFVVATKVLGHDGSGPQSERAQPQAYHRVMRGFAAPVGDGLHRSVPDPSMGL